MKQAIITFLSVVAIFLSSAVYAGASSQSLDDIEQTAFIYASNAAQARFNNASVIVSALDERLKLAKCDVALQAFNRSDVIKMGNQTIGVTCSGKVSWTVYVPVKVKVLRAVVMTTRTLSPGQPITRQDLKLHQMDVSNLRPGYYTSPDQVVGKVVKYSVVVGRVLTKNNIEKETVMHRGDAVTLLVESGAMSIQVAGEAMQDGAVGDSIKVRNVSSQKVVFGKVMSSRVVKVAMH